MDQEIREIQLIVEEGRGGLRGLGMGMGMGMGMGLLAHGVRLLVGSANKYRARRWDWRVTTRDVTNGTGMDVVEMEKWVSVKIRKYSILPQ